MIAKFREKLWIARERPDGVSDASAARRDDSVERRLGPVDERTLGAARSLQSWVLASCGGGAASAGGVLASGTPASGTPPPSDGLWSQVQVVPFGAQ